MSPRQVLVIPVALPHKAYAQEVADLLWKNGFYADADLSDNTLPKKVRNGEIAQYNFIFGELAVYYTYVEAVTDPLSLICPIQSWAQKRLIRDRSTYATGTTSALRDARPRLSSLMMFSSRCIH